MVTVWATATKLASQKVERVKEELATLVSASNIERDEALAEVSKLEGRVATLITKEYQQDEQIKRLEQELSEATTNLSTQSISAAKYEAETLAKTAQIELLQGIVEELRENNKKLHDLLSRTDGNK